MTNIVPLAPAIASREAENSAIRAELLALAVETQFPGGQIIDQGTGQPTLNAEAENKLRRMFALFGVTGLDPLDLDFDLVSNTWYELNKVGGNLRSRQLFEDTLYKAQRGIWHPAYAAYIDALWGGSLPAIASAAATLNIPRGIPESAPRLREGPIK